jgi:hypothetical protein
MSQPSATIVKEGQVSVASTILDRVYQQNETTSRSTLKAKIYDAYHGQNGKACQIEEFIKGAPPYSSLFSQDGTANCSPDGATEHTLVMSHERKHPSS